MFVVSFIDGSTQLLNMYRGDPTAVRVKEISENWEPRYGNENERLKRLDTACLRANLEQPPRMKRPGDKTKPESDAEHRHHVPCDFKLHFNQFIPTFHHVYNAQATVSRYGVKTLFEVGLIIYVYSRFMATLSYGNIRVKNIFYYYENKFYYPYF